MSDQQNNPSAFPNEMWDDEDQLAIATPGMTLRDYFAAKAMGGLLSDAMCNDFNSPSFAPTIAGRSYKMADAMLKERQSK